MADDLLALGATDLARRIASRTLSPVEIVAAVIERIEALQPSLNAFITVTAEEALRAAQGAEAALRSGDRLGPLHGLPFSVKDLTLTAGIRTTFGSRLYADHVPGEDAVPVARARAAGAILVGKTTTPEFGHKALTEAPLFGRTLNPWDPDVTCGGSSGGAAVALAAGMGPLALGTDGGGSIRIPASCCGVVGLKPTLGRVPHIHVPDLFGANSFIGPMARNVADTRLLFEAIAGPDRRDPFGQGAPVEAPRRPSPAGLRIGWLRLCGNALLDEEVDAACSAAMRRLEELGGAVEPIELDFAALEPAFLAILESALAARLHGVPPEREALIDPSLSRTVAAGRRRSAVELQEAAAARSAAFRAVQATFERVDVIASPTLAAPPLPVDQDPHGRVTIGGRTGGLIRGTWYPYTFPFNLTGHPALSLPCGFTRRGLPIGLQLAGRWHADHMLLDVAASLEEALGLGHRQPADLGRRRMIWPQ